MTRGFKLRLHGPMLGDRARICLRNLTASSGVAAHEVVFRLFEAQSAAALFGLQLRLVILA